MTLYLNGTTGVSGVDGSAGTPSLQGNDTNTGIVFGTDTVGVSTGGVQRTTVDSSGRLLVGTSTSATAGDAQYAKVQIRGNTFGANEWGTLALMRDSAASTGLAAGTFLGGITFADSIGERFGSIHCAADATTGSNDYPGRLVFSTCADGASSPTERLRISSVGNVGISDVSSVNPNYGLLEITRPQDQPDNKFHLAFHRYANKICGMGFLDNSQTFAIQNADNNTGNGVTLAANGTSWGTTSDERKKRIGASIENGLDKIADWRCVYFSYLNESEDVQRVGLIAQDVQQTLPEAVFVEEDEIGTLQLKYAELIPVLVKALQEAKQRIETLEAAVAALDAA